MSALAAAVFWLALALVLYAYLGYPLLVGLAARLRPAPRLARAPRRAAVSVIVVARDEEAVIAEKLRNCLELEPAGEPHEVILVSDGSRDATEEIAEGFATRGVRLLRQPAPRGKPAALNRAVAEARGELLLLTDARQRLAPDALRELAACFADPSVGAASGELHLGAPGGASAHGGLGSYWSFEKWIRRAESRLDSTVGVTGAIWALRRELYRPLDERTILDDVALPMEVVLQGRRVVFEPEARAFDRIAAEPGREFRRKVRTLAGNLQLAALRPALLDPRRNRLFWQFVSHKLARLAVPWCLLLLALSALPLALAGRPVYAAALAAQLALWGAAAAGGLLQRMGRPVRLLSLPYTFAMLNLAAAAGWIGFLRGSETAAWKRAAA